MPRNGDAMDKKNAPAALDDRRVEALLSDAQRAWQLRDQKRFGEALQVLREVIRRAWEAGLGCYEIQYSAACFALEVGELEEAMTYALSSVRMDPLSSSCRDVLERTAARLRAKLADEDRDPGDDSTPRLHALLVRAGKASPRCHVALARHLAHEGDNQGALRLLAAVTQLAPNIREAWLLRRELALAVGDGALAERCSLECAADASEADESAPISYIGAGFAQA